ncbi:MAG: hypothetical protein NC548_05870 [Lachnospiraceae bacterium]|nr:hypothetical protein [Lachnospiraceae bacterium]
MHKIPIIIINGKGGCGKDSLIDGVAAHCWWPVTRSAVDKVKEAATVLGWDGGKSDKDRKFLHEMKNLSTEFNDGPNTYLCNEVISILLWCLPDEANMDTKFPHHIPKSPMYLFNRDLAREEFYNNGVIFLHCREPENIAALLESLHTILFDHKLDQYATVMTVIVSRKDTDEHVYGNHCDDDVYDYIYDYYIDNNGSLEEGIIALNDVLHQIAGDRY